MESKRCPKCGEVKNLTMFYNQKSSPDGKGSYCKECTKSNRKKWSDIMNGDDGSYYRWTYKRNKENISIYQKKNRDELRDGYICATLNIKVSEKDRYKDLIELKRAYLLGKRTLKKCQQ